MQPKKQFKVPENEVGTVVKTQKGKLALKVSQDITLKAGEYLMLETPQAKIEGLVSRGYITKEQGEERISKTPEWVRQYVTRMKDKKTSGDI